MPKKNMDNLKKSQYEGKLFYAKTNIVVPIKTTTDVMAGILSETIIYVTAPQPDRPNEFAGLEIATADDVKNVFIRVNMEYDKFNEFYSKRKKYNFGICLQTLNEALKIVDKDDSLTMYIDESDIQYLVIEINNDNDGVHTMFKISILDLDNRYKEKKKIDFDIEIVLDGTRFHNLFKQMGKIGEHVDLKCTSKNLIFTCIGDKLQRITKLKVNKGIMSIKKEESKQKIVQGIYDVRNVVLFTKCATICGDINIYMKNGFPLTVCYPIPNYGTFTVAFTPTSDDHINNEDYPYSDDEENIEMLLDNDGIIEDDSDFDENPKSKKSNIRSNKKKDKIEDDEDNEDDNSKENNEESDESDESDSDED